jgi:phosphate:Na+ symporter
MRGTARQVAMAQVLYNVAGLALFGTLFYVEFFSDTDLLHRLMERLFPRPDQEAAGVALLFNFVTPLAFSVAPGPWARFLARHWRPSERETLARPQFLQEQALEQPATALVLAEKEQLRLLGWLPGHLDAARAGASAADLARRRAYHEAFREVAEQIRPYLTQLLQQSMPAETAELLLNLQNRQEHLETLEGFAWEMLENLRDHLDHPGDAVRALGLRLLEGFDTQLLTLIAALANDDAEELAMLRTMTADRGETMEGVRRGYFTGGESLAPADRPRLLHFTNVFERAAWTISRYAELVSDAWVHSGHAAAQ